MTSRQTLAMLIAIGAVAAPDAWQAPAAPQAPPKENIVVKGKAPVSDAVLRVKLPRAQEADLPNGLHLMVLEDRRAPQVAVQLVIRGAGGYYDPVDHAGLAQFTAANLREGTTTRSSPQIAEQLEQLAAIVNVSSGMSSEDATLTVVTLAEHVDQVLDLAADLVLNPIFPEQELARYKTQTRAQLLQQRSQPAFLARERFNQVLAEGHPDGRLAPSVEALDKTTREGLVAFHRTRYVPDHAVIAFAGDIDLESARKKVETRFARWTNASRPMPEVADPKALADPGVFLVARPNSVQTNLLVGVQAIRYTDPDFYKLTVLNKVVGGGASGRLFRHLREEKGYTYGAYSSLTARRHRGMWVANTEVRTEVTEAALGDLLDELRQVREIRIPEQELADAKRSLVASFALELESPAALLENALTRWRYGLPADYWDRYPDEIMAVAQADVQAAARTYFDAARVQIVAVGDAATVQGVLSKIGRLQVYDAEGNKITK